MVPEIEAITFIYFFTVYDKSVKNDLKGQSHEMFKALLRMA
jgi:hypothetical protein